MFRGAGGDSSGSGAIGANAQETVIDPWGLLRDLAIRPNFAGHDRVNNRKEEEECIRKDTPTSQCSAFKSDFSAFNLGKRSVQQHYGEHHLRCNATGFAFW